MKCAIFVVILASFYAATATKWSDIQMPAKSSFKGLEPPTDTVRWTQARNLAASGEQILLKRVLQTVKNPMDFIQGKISFKDIHQLGDAFISRANGGLESLKSQYSHKRPPLTLFGFRTFDSSNFEGREKKFDGFHPETIGDHVGKLPRKMVVIGTTVTF